MGGRGATVDGGLTYGKRTIAMPIILTVTLTHSYMLRVSDMMPAIRERQLRL